MLLIDTHLNRTFNLSQNPLAAARSSSLVGRWVGRWKYFDTEDAIDSGSTGVPPWCSGLGIVEGSCFGGGGGVVFAGLSLPGFESVCSRRTEWMPLLAAVWRLRCHASRASRYMPSLCDAPTSRLESAAAAQDAAIAGDDAELESRPRSRSPPPVRPLFFTVCPPCPGSARAPLRAVDAEFANPLAEVVLPGLRDHRPAFEDASPEARKDVQNRRVSNGVAMLLDMISTHGAPEEVR